MSIFYRQHANERAFCRALLNNENPVWEDNDMFKRRKKGCRLPPDDFVYGLKHPKQDGTTGVAAGKYPTLQQYCTFEDEGTSSNIPQSKSMPNFIAINKAATRLGLTTVHDIHQYRKKMSNHPLKINHIEKALTSDMIHGRATGAQQSIRDVLENKYLHEWLHTAAIRRCKEILKSDNSKLTTKSIKMTKAALLKQDLNMRKKQIYCK